MDYHKNTSGGRVVASSNLQEVRVKSNLFLFIPG